MASMGMWFYELDQAFTGMVRTTWWLDVDFLIEFKYYLKDQAGGALGGIQKDARLILEMLKGALEAGKELAEAFIAEIREIVGLGKVSIPCELEMVDMAGECYPTE